MEFGCWWTELILEGVMMEEILVENNRRTTQNAYTDNVYVSTFLLLIAVSKKRTVFIFFASGIAIEVYFKTHFQFKDVQAIFGCHQKQN